MLNISDLLKRILLLTLLVAAPDLSEALKAQDTGKEYVTIYEDFDEGQFGRSEKRSDLRGIRFEQLRKTESFNVILPENPGQKGSWLTAIVLSADTAEKIRSGLVPLEREFEKDPSSGKEIVVYTFSWEGILIRFSLEKPPEAMLEMIRKHYANDLRWKEPVLDHYRKNYVIRIHTSENALDSWNEEITYGDALISATLIGDRDQWLWGIHNGNDLLRRIYLASKRSQSTPPPFIED